MENESPERDPDARPTEGFLEPDDMGFPVEHPEIKREHTEDEGEEDKPSPDHAGGLEGGENFKWEVHVWWWLDF